MVESAKHDSQTLPRSWAQQNPILVCLRAKVCVNRWLLRTDHAMKRTCRVAFGAIRLLSRGAFDRGRLWCFCYNYLIGVVQGYTATYQLIRDLATQICCQGLLM